MENVINGFKFEGDCLTEYIGDGGTVIIPDGFRCISKDAFWNTEKKENIQKIIVPKDIEEVVSMTSNQYVWWNLLEDLPRIQSAGPIGSGCSLEFAWDEKIPAHFFEGSYIEKLRLPGTIKEAGENCFSGMKYIREVYIESIESWLSLINGAGSTNPLNRYYVRFSDNKEKNTLYLNNKPIAELVIPEGVEIIPAYAFAACRSITAVRFPSTLKRIGESAFLFCSGIKEIELPEGILLERNAFECCFGLSKVVVPASTQLKIKESPTGIENQNIFYKCRSIKSIGPLGSGCDLEYGWDVLEEGIFSNTGAEIIYIPASMKEIKPYAVSSNGRLQEVIFEGPVEKIDSKAFWDNDPALSTNFSSFAKTTSKLPAVLAQMNAQEDFDTECFGYIALFQNAKGWKQFIASFPLDEALNDEAVKVISKLIREKKEVTDSMAANACDFVLANTSLISEECLKEFNSAVSEKKFKKTIAKLKADPIFTERISGGSSGDEDSNPVEAMVGKNWKYDDVVKRLSKLIKKGVHYKDSDEISTPNAVIFVFSEYERQIPERRKGIAVSEYKTGAFDFRFMENADAVAAGLDRRELGDLASELELFPSRGRFGDEKQIAEMITSMNAWKSWYDYGLSGRQNIILARGALLLSDTKAAIMALDKVKLLDKYAKMRGTTSEEIRDFALSDVGLDEDGKKYYDIGNKTIEVSLNENLSFELYDPETNKTVKSIPKRGADTRKADEAGKDFALLKKNTKNIIKNRVMSLEEEFISGKGKKPQQWHKTYIDNPVLRSVASLVVWKQGNVSFTVKGKELIDPSGRSIGLADDMDIIVAHPMDMAPEDVKAWQKYFTDHSLKQPFSQIWEPVIDLNNVKKDRYKGIMIPYYRFLNKEKLGIFIQDEDFHNEIYIGFDSCNAQVERKEFRRHAIEMDDSFEITSITVGKDKKKANHLLAYLDTVTALERAKNDDTSVVEILDGFTLAQIQELIKAANEANAVNVTALLMDHKNRNYADYNEMSDLTLEL